jgi:hypothetical protein
LNGQLDRELDLSIEGFHVSADEAVAIVTGQEPPMLDDESRQAVACYARAIDHVGVMARDPGFRWYDRVILDLHFDACFFQRDKSPGRWRSGPIGVSGGSGRIIYQAPDADDLPRLMGEVVDWLESAASTRTSSRAKISCQRSSPRLRSYLGEHTADYYSARQQVQGGRYQPEREAAPWVSFCIDAHLAQARRRARRRPVLEAPSPTASFPRIASPADWGRCPRAGPRRSGGPNRPPLRRRPDRQLRLCAC